MTNKNKTTRNLLFYIANKKGLLKSALIIKCFRVVYYYFVSHNFKYASPCFKYIFAIEILLKVLCLKFSKAFSFVS